MHGFAVDCNTSDVNDYNSNAIIMIMIDDDDDDDIGFNYINDNRIAGALNFPVLLSSSSPASEILQCVPSVV